MQTPMDSTVQLIEDLSDVALGRRAEMTRPIASLDRSEMDMHLTAAADNAAVDALPVPAGRSRATKQFILKGGRFVFTRQSAYNRAVLALVREALDELTELSGVVEQQRRRAAAEATAAEAMLRDAEIIRHRKLDEMRVVLDDFRGRVDATEEVRSENGRRLDDLQAELLLERHRRGVLERELRALRSDMRNSVPAAPANGALDSATEDVNLAELYQRFEQHFRPTGEELDQRFATYVPDVEHLRGGQLRLLDIGAGRGDFLEILRAAGIPATGVDSNPMAVDEATKRGLDVVLADAMDHLESQTNESLGAVTAFHVVEHLEPSDLVRLVDEIVRVLAPGGVVILETPNPTNLVVGAANFYLDPTHQRPIAPDYLAFLLRDRGLVDVETRFLHPLPEFDLPLGLTGLPGEGAVGLLLHDLQWALKGPMDYAVVARGAGRT